MEFKNRQKIEFKKLLRRLPEYNNRQTVESVVLRYVGFESVTRLIWHFYRCRFRARSFPESGVNIVEIKKSLRYFELSIDDQTINRLLSSGLTKRNHKSIRNLRNKVFHQWKKKDCQEILSRVSEIHGYFDEFFGVFEKFK